jgi:YVTN family beta-propeller protein
MEEFASRDGILGNFRRLRGEVPSRVWSRCLGVLVAVLTLAQSSKAQKFVANVPVEEYGHAFAVNPETHKIYAVSEPGNELTEIDLRTFEKTVIPLGPTQEKSLDGAIRIDVARNKIYVTNVVNNSVAVIDGFTHKVKFVPTGKHPTTMEFNAKTNRLYVANSDGDSVTVVDCRKLKTKTVAVGSYPLGIAINSKTNTVYVTNAHSNNVTVIQGKKNRVRTVAVGAYPVAVAVNQATNRVYVGNLQVNTVTVIEGRSLKTHIVEVNPYPFWLTVNEKTNKIYMIHQASNTITVIDGRTSTIEKIGAGIIPAGASNALAVDELRNRIYVAEWTTRVTVIDGATNTTSTVANPEYNTLKIIANPGANEFYTLNMTTNVSNKNAASGVGIFAGAK